MNTILLSRFKQVSDATIAAVEAVNDLEILKNLVIKAALSDSIDAFEDYLKTAQKSLNKKAPENIVSEVTTEYKPVKSRKPTGRKS